MLKSQAIGMDRVISLDKMPLWTILEQHAERLKKQKLISLVESNTALITEIAIGQEKLALDYTRNFLDIPAMADLCALAEVCSLKPAMTQLFSGVKINHTEGRAVLHSLLRMPEKIKSALAPEPELAGFQEDILRERAKMFKIVEKLRCGEWKGATGKRIAHIVNIGIGGSDLGPVMAVNALKPYWSTDIQLHFVSNIDPTGMADALEGLNPETTLFIISSKSFTTEETLENAKLAQSWLKTGLNKEDISTHLIAVTARPASAQAFGVVPDNILSIWDWVGGRYSIWSSIGLPLAIKIGVSGFEEFLAGAHEIDKHFQTADFSQNIPVLLALLGLWYQHFWGAQTHAVIPYSNRLQYFPDYLQQLDMESNGKTVDYTGEQINYPTGPIIWGGIGTNTQHAFFQLLHQGQHCVSLDFILPLLAEGPRPSANHIAMHKKLVANCFGQARALMTGAPQDAIPGNRASNMITVSRLTPGILGALIAIYEHKVFSQGVIWNINSFDQPGVQLGKTVAQEILNVMEGAGRSDIDVNLDSATQQSIVDFLKWERKLEN